MPSAGAGAAAAFLLLIGLSFVPLGPGETKYALLSAAAAFPAALLYLTRGAELPAPARREPLVLLLAWAGLGTAWAPDRYRALTALLWLLVLASVASLAARWGTRSIPAIATLFLAAAVPALIHGLLQAAGLLPHEDWANPIRLAGTFVNSNLYAVFAATAALLGMGLALSPGLGWPRRTLGALAVLLASVSLPLTTSRGGMLAAAVGLVLLVGLRTRRAGRARVLLLAVAATGVVLLFLGARLGLFARAAERLAGAGSYSVGHRTAIWTGTFGLLRSRPLGVGLGGFEAAFPGHQIHSDRFVVNFAHSDFLELAAVLGVPGLVLCALGLWRLRGRLAPLEDPSLAWHDATLATLACWAAASAWDFPLRRPTLGLLAAALLGALARREREAAPARPSAAPWLAAAAAGAGGLALLLLRGEQRRATALALAEERALTEAHAAFRAADRALLGLDPALARSAGAFDLHVSRLPGLAGPGLSASLGWYKLAVDRSPLDAEAHLALALARSGLGQRGEARHHALEASRLAPMSGQTLTLASRLLRAGGDEAEAFRLAALALDTSPERSTAEELAGHATRARLSPELVALAPRASSSRTGEFTRALDLRGATLAARLLAARIGPSEASRP